jgi:adenylate kinase family enzyme
MVGPPGAGCASQAESIAEKFGLVCINPAKLVNEELKTN